jgi:hypothetical protein
VVLNVRKAIEVGEEIAKRGHVPFIPHLTMLWHILYPHTDIEFWYNYDNEWLKSCDALFRIPGESTGAEDEVRLARRLGFPIYHDLVDLP